VARGSGCQVSDVLEAANGSVITGCNLSPLSGYTVVLEPPAAPEFWDRAYGLLGVQGLGGQAEWEALRVVQGRPYPDRELTQDYTPLEAGLWHTVHFEKG
jgi:tRNA-modifying protein YgfZ